MIRIEEAIGATMAVQETQFVHLLARDQFSGDEFGYLSSPVWVSTEGAPVHSMERWFRVVFEPPFTEIRNVSLWSPQILGPGWILRYGVSELYQKPTRNQSAIATTPMPTTRPDVPNIVGSAGLLGPAEQRTPWIVVQALVDGDAASGPPLGYEIDGRPRSLIYHLEWGEL